MTGRLQVRVAGVGVIAPGLPGWQSSRTILRKQSSPDLQEMLPLVPAGISPRERRRLTEIIKLALVAGEDALQNLMVPVAIEQLSTVFASADGDLFIADKILSALTLPGQPVSPTQFHNSVHNAPAGYWHLASHSMHASISIAGGVNSFVCGLLEAATQVVTTGEPCLLVVCDTQPPQSYKREAGSFDSLAIALVLQAVDCVNASVECETLEITAATESADASTLDNPELELLRCANPAARGLPLLQLLADKDIQSVVLRGGLANGVEIKRVNSAG